MELKICHLYPDILNLYGDRGNVLCMEKRLQWRGMEVSTTGVSVGESLDASRYDLFFVGGGQDFEMEVLLNDLASGKAAQIKSAIEDGKTFLAICGGYQMLGQYYKTPEGKQYDFIGALDLYTEGSQERLIGDYIFSCEETGGEVVGFENHAGKTWLGASVRPLGHVIRGCGNNGQDGTEGARYNNVFASYSHGCLLPKNPVLCDYILHTALQQKYGQVEWPTLDDILETNAHQYMVRRLTGK